MAPGGEGLPSKMTQKISGKGVKMFLSTLFIALIFSGSASVVEVKKAVGDDVSFRPEKPLPSPINSIAWKHRNNVGVVVKAIEWDEDGFSILNDRFIGITTLNEKTAEMTIKPVDFSHIGEYFFEVNSKEQEEKFKLIVNVRVPKPVINIERSKSNPDVVYLNCDHSDKSDQIIWKNSNGETLPNSPVKEEKSITVEKVKEDPNNFYTCTLKNDVSEETSDPIHVKDLFTGPTDGRPWWIVFIVIPLVAGVAGVAGALGYNLSSGFRTQVQRLPCFKGQGDNSGGSNKLEAGYQAAPTTENNIPEAAPTTNTGNSTLATDDKSTV